MDEMRLCFFVFTLHGFFCIYRTFLCSPLKQGTPALAQSSIAADLLKGTITRLATEDPSSPDKARGEQLAKGHVIYEGKSGHIVSYDSCKCLLLSILQIAIFLCLAHSCYHMFYCPVAIKNPRENTRSPRTSHELKRTFNMMEEPMGRGHTGREGAPLEGTACVSLNMHTVSFLCQGLTVPVSVVSPSGLISRALPRESIHGESKERPVITGSIMQGSLL